VSSGRERVAIVFMTISAIMTLILGAAVAYEVAHPRNQVVSVSQASGSEPASGTASSGATGTGITAAAGTAATTGTAGHAVTTGGGSATVSSATGATVGVSRGLITVGGIYDETGPVDATVERDTVRSYFNMVNAKGGVNGYKFQLLDCDSGYDPQQAHQCSDRLLSQGILAIVGWTSVNGEQPETPYLTGKGVPVVGGLGVPAEFASPLSYPQTAAFETYGTAMGTHAADLGIKKPGLVLLNANFIKPVEQALLNALHKHGIHETSTNEVDATKADYTDIAVKLRSEGADSVIAALDPFSYARLYQAMDRQSWHPKFLGLGLDKKSAQQQYASAVYGAESLTPVLEIDGHESVPAVSEYLSAVKKYYPNQFSALDVYTVQQWLAAKFFVQAVAKIGSQPVTRKSLVAAMNSIKAWNNGFTVPLTYAAGNVHDPNRCFQWTRNQQGTWQTYSGWKCF
jgi:ABC-type branched-subunit amino acid transport system substrate-binding protein